MKKKYTFNIASETGKSKKLILFKDLMETEEHIALKLIAYLYFFEYEIKPETSVLQKYKPDLVIFDDPLLKSNIKFWIECKDVSAKELDRVLRKNRNADVYLFNSENAIENRKNKLRKEIRDIDRFYVAKVTNMEMLAWKLRKEKRLDIYFTIHDDKLNLYLGEDVLELGAGVEEMI
ncbi:MAG: hypothetical protein A7316_00105 [Candidatus Altiarchaeales archaeon WOR_SM1_86-2]|nr:MAG: hypothetical protein A7316_00105 [Candidatus Altiarchaeales archaeon WOR_SM1_86-2]